MSDEAAPLPLDSWHRARGGRMVPFAGYAMPVQYEGIMAEHKWTRESAGLFDVSHMGQLIIAGPDAEKGLESLLPADLTLLKDGRLRYSLMLNAEGGIIDDLMVTRRGAHFYGVVNGATKAGDIEHLQARLPRTVVLDHMKEQALLALQGPKAAAALSRLAPGVEQLAFMAGSAFEIGGAKAWVSRSGYTGEDGFEISILARDAETVATLLCDQDEVKPIGLGARDSLRLEAGLPLYGHDLDQHTTPVEADLTFAVSKRRRAEGGIIDDLMVTRRGEHFYMVVNGATKAGDIEHLQARLPRTVVLDHMKEQALLALQGPKAFDVLKRHVTGRYPLDALTFMAGGPFELAGAQCWISRSGYTGEDGFELSFDATEAERIADLLCAEPEVKPIGLGARDSLRLEAGLPLYGHDLDTETTPVMADLGFALSKRRREEGNFPGAQRILMEREQGPVTKRVGLMVEGRQPVREGAAVLDADGSEVGKVTSGGFAPSVGAPIAMAYVPLAMAAPGTVIQIAQRGKVHQATVTAMPFVPHRYVRAGGK
jgi:aminomethyltransferase